MYFFTHFTTFSLYKILFSYSFFFSGQSLYEFEDQRLSRPRHLPSSLVPPSRSTSVPPTTDGRESNGASHYALPREDHRRSASPAGSLIGEPPILNPPHIAQQQPYRGGPAGGPLAHPPTRSMSPRYFRPPPGVGPPHFRGPGPPWGRGPRPPFDPRFLPRGPPRRHPMGPRGPPGYHPGHRSRMPGMNILVSEIIANIFFESQLSAAQFLFRNLVPNYATHKSGKCLSHF